MSQSPDTEISSTPRSPVPGGSASRPLPSVRSGRSHHRVLASTSRMAALELLRSRAEPLGVSEVAEHIGLHQNTARSHLDLLVDSGYAVRRRGTPDGPGRPRVVYEATAAPDGERNYRLLAEVLAQHLVATSGNPGEVAVQAGRSWAALAGRGEHSGVTVSAPQTSTEVAAAIAAVVRMLGDLGFAPELSTDATAINLRRCPFRELAEANPDVVCGAHLGMIQGALDELGAPVSATRLIPMVQPDLCIATLTRSATADHPATRT